MNMIEDRNAFWQTNTNFSCRKQFSLQQLFSYNKTIILLTLVVYDWQPGQLDAVHIVDYQPMHAYTTRVRRRI
jgi:hypothetical protein